MSESTTPSDKKVPGAQPPWAPGNRANEPLKCERCGSQLGWVRYRARADAILCRTCYRVNWCTCDEGQ